MTASRHWTLAAVLVGAALLTGAAAGADSLPAIALINESPSLPKGLYIRMAGGRVEPGAIVAIPQPGSARAYLAGLGMPPDVQLLKRVSAVGGDPVCSGEGTVRTPRTQVAVHRRDRRGVSLGAWRECRDLGPDELFLLGDTPGSFDSRYFGPVSRSAVTGVYREVLTW